MQDLVPRPEIGKGQVGAGRNRSSLRLLGEDTGEGEDLCL